MRAAIAASKGHVFDIAEVELDELRDDEVIVRIHGVGICHSDVAAAEQHLPFKLPAVLGHEGAGIVERIGRSVTKVAVGDHVVLTIDSCGHCRYCAQGRPSYCESGGALNFTGTRIDGSSTIHAHGEPLSACFFGQSSFAELAIAHERSIVKIDRDLPLEIMGALGCGLQTGAGAVIRSMEVEAGSSLLVTGGGTVGLAAVMAAVVRGCSTIIVSEPHGGRRDFAVSLGATHAVDPTADDMTEAVRRIVPQGVDYAFDTTARGDVIAGAVQALASLGTIGLVGVPSDPTSTLPMNMLDVIGRGITVRGINEGDSEPDDFIPEMIALFRAGRFPFDRMCKTYPLDKINEAVADQLAGRCIKPILVPERDR